MGPQPSFRGRAELPRKLGLLDATNIVVGTMIGSAIFIVPASIAQDVPSAPAILAAWLLGGVLSLCGALAYAELGAMMPATGGQYVYLREAWGPLWGFLCGWTFFFAARSGGIAAVAAAFAIYVSHFVPISPVMSRIVAALLILVLAFVNYRGVRLGANVQNVFSGLKVLGLVVLIASMFGTAPAASGEPVPDASVSLKGFGAAMIACLWAYNGWFAVSLVSGEIKNPSRNIPLSIIVGTSAVTVLYLLANTGYLRIFGIGEIAGAERIAAAAAERSMGSIGSAFVAATILISTFGTTNGNTLTAPRIYFAQARDGLFFRRFADIHPRFQTPHWSIAGQGIWCAILALTGSYMQLVSYAVFSFWLFYGLTVAGLIVLRRKFPDAPRPYRMWGYPVTPILFVVASAWVAASSVLSSPWTTLIGSAIIASGVPAYFVWRRLSAGSQPAA
jgi:basic amino acid/polyamine antiporter, APA family